MAVTHGRPVFTLAAGASVGFRTVFVSHSVHEGGEYVGPIVVAAIPYKPANQIVTPSTVSVELKTPGGDIIGNCVYHYSVRNEGTAAVSFVLHFLHD